MECKRIKATFGKAGGTAAKNNQVVRIVIPADWVRKMKLTKENAYLEAEFENGYIFDYYNQMFLHNHLY